MGILMFFVTKLKKKSRIVVFAIETKIIIIYRHSNNIKH